MICEHSLNLPNVTWGHDSIVWNNLVYKTLKYGYLTEINEVEKKEVLELLQLEDSSKEFENCVLLDEFFFKILAVLTDKYKDENVCLDLMIGHKLTSAPSWDNFNKFQTEQHLKQIVPVNL